MNTAVKLFNAIVIALQKIGIVFGPLQILTVTGRKSGEPRTTPIAVQQIDGSKYVWQAYPRAAWVANVRAADTVTLTRGRHSRAAKFIEIPLSERGPILLKLAQQMAKTHRNRLVVTGLAPDNSPEAIAAAAEHIAVFRIDDA